MGGLPRRWVGLSRLALVTVLDSGVATHQRQSQFHWSSRWLGCTRTMSCTPPFRRTLTAASLRPGAVAPPQQTVDCPRPPPLRMLPNGGHESRVDGHTQRCDDEGRGDSNWACGATRKGVSLKPALLSPCDCTVVQSASERRIPVAPLGKHYPTFCLAKRCQPCRGAPGCKSTMTLLVGGRRLARTDNTGAWSLPSCGFSESCAQGQVPVSQGFTGGPKEVILIKAACSLVPNLETMVAEKTQRQAKNMGTATRNWIKKWCTRDS